jgi:hypothetical protein
VDDFPLGGDTPPATAIGDDPLTGVISDGPLSAVLGQRAATHASVADRGARASDIAAVVRVGLRLPPDQAITVTQLACREPGCPPVETVIAVLGHPPRRWTIHRPLTEIDTELVIGLITSHMNGDQGADSDA